MNDYSRELAPSTFSDALAHMAEHDIPLSDAVQAAAAEMERVRSLQPVHVEAQDLTALYGARRSKPADLVLFAAEVSTLGSRSESWRQALIRAATAGLTTISAEVGDIIEVLRPAALAHIAELVWFSDSGSPDVTQLVREHRPDEATRAASAPLHYADLEALVKLRQELSGKRGFDWSKGARFANPEMVSAALAHKKQLFGLDFIAAGVAAGGVLWWPSMAEASTVHERVVDADDAAQTEEHRKKQAIYHSAF